MKAEEYSLLEQIKGEDYVKLSPDNTLVAAAIEDGRIVGRLVALNLPHLEALWIDPEYRGGIVLAEMEKLMTEKLKELGAEMAFAFAVNEEMESYIQRLGYTKFATAWRKEL